MCNLNNTYVHTYSKSLLLSIGDVMIETYFEVIDEIKLLLSFSVKVLVSVT